MPLNMIIVAITKQEHGTFLISTVQPVMVKFVAIGNWRASITSHRMGQKI